MVSPARLDADTAWFDPDDVVRDDRIHGRVYTDPRIFALEMDRIFGRAWVYVAHETELPRPNDFKTTHIGRQPVVITRDADGRLHALYNRCRHRASTVCHQETGNAVHLRCSYHGWTYNTRGDLVGVPFREGYDAAFDPREHGLVPVPRFANYRGFLFASVAPDGPTLEEQLGNARPYVDRIAAQGPQGIEATAGVQKYGYDANWKLQLENTVDNYHVSFIHKTFTDLLAQRAGKRGEWHEGVQRDLGNGHGTLEFAAQEGAATGGLPFNMVVFPNLAFVGTHIRVVRPIAVDRTEVALYPTLIVGAPSETNARRLRVHEESFGPGGFVGPDDAEVAMVRVQEGLQAKPADWVLLARGLHREKLDERGVRTCHITDEAGQRALYRQWKRLMATP
jgi:phenylpropionate dioxygenase-like ring-hydroxylating dioxygenase large terminal subunit